MSQIQKYGEAVKRLDRLAPNLAHICISIREWIFAKQIAPQETRGHLGRGFRGQTFKSMGKLSNGWTDWHLLWFTSADSSGNGPRLTTIRPTIPQGHFGGHKFKSMGNLSNSWTDWHQIWYTSADSSGNGHMLNTIRPSISHGAFGGGVKGSHIQKYVEAVKRLDRLAPNLAHICKFICE